MSKSLGRLNREEDVLEFDGWNAQYPGPTLKRALARLKLVYHPDFTGQDYEVLRRAVLDYIHLTTHPAPTRMLTEKLRRIRATVQRNKRGKNVR